MPVPRRELLAAPVTVASAPPAALEAPPAAAPVPAAVPDPAGGPFGLGAMACVIAAIQLGVANVGSKNTLITN